MLLLHLTPQITEGFQVFQKQPSRPFENLACSRPSKDAFDVTVTEVAPTLGITVNGAASASTSEGSAVTFTATITDPDATDTTTLYADFTGSGVYEQVDPSIWTSSTVNGAVTTITFPHYYDTNANYSAKFYADNDSLTSSTISFPVTITPVAPSGGLMTNAINSAPYWDGGNAIPFDHNGVRPVVVNEGGSLSFQNVTDPSLADTAKLTYWWWVGGWYPRITTVNDFVLPKTDYSGTGVTLVKAEIRSPNGLWSAPQYIDVYTDAIDPSNRSQGNGVMAAYGTFAVSDTPAQDYYDPTAPQLLQLGEVPQGTQKTSTFTPDQATLALDPNSPKLLYRYSFMVTPTNVGSDSQAVVSEMTLPLTTATSFTFTPSDANGADSKNRRIEVTVTPMYVANNPTGNSPSYTYTMTTPPSKGLWGTLTDYWELIKNLNTVFSNAGSQVASAAADIGSEIFTKPTRFFNTLTNGLQTVLTKFTTGLPKVIENASLTWLARKTSRFLLGRTSSRRY